MGKFYDSPLQIIEEATELARAASVMVSNVNGNEYGYEGEIGRALTDMSLHLHGVAIARSRFLSAWLKSNMATAHLFPNGL